VLNAQRRGREIVHEANNEPVPERNETDLELMMTNREYVVHYKREARAIRGMKKKDLRKRITWLNRQILIARIQKFAASEELSK